jgi:hypothetical protein
MTFIEITTQVLIDRFCELCCVFLHKEKHKERHKEKHKHVLWKIST